MDRQGDSLRLLGRRITELRQERQLTIETLASATGLDPRKLAAIEAGETDIPITTIFHLARAFGITPDKLVDFLP
jgi:transcriptional regulator with XRE-family HTH domain